MLMYALAYVIIMKTRKWGVIGFTSVSFFVVWNLGNVICAGPFRQ